ncbi:hypothetical protein [Gordonia rhizosphera]|nr:hypothetical protein [Gordonia rhizosphera]
MSVPIQPVQQPAGEPGGEQRPKRPDAVTIAAELWAAVILGQIIGFIAQYPTMRDTWDRQIASMPADTPKEELDVLTSSALLITVMAVAGVALTVVSVTLVLLTRAGYNWARIVVAAMGVFLAVNAGFMLFGDVSPTWVMIPLVISGVAGIGSSVLLLRRESEQYCRAMTAYRRRPPRPAQPAWPPAGPPNGPYSGYGPGQPPYWPYGEPQQPPPGPPHVTRPPSNEGNEFRGQS